MTDLHASPSHLLHRARQRADELLARHLTVTGITPRQFTILNAINCTPGISQKKIAEMTGSDRSTIAELIARLERIGLIKRVRSKNDGRARTITLTDMGAACVERSIPAVRSADAALLAMIPAEQQQSFIAGLVTIGIASE